MRSSVIGMVLATSLLLSSPRTNAAEETSPIDLPILATISKIEALSSGTSHVGEITMPLSLSRAACPSGVTTLDIQIRGITGRLLVRDVLPATAQEEIFRGPILIRRETTFHVDGSAGVGLRYVGEQVTANGQLETTASHNATSEMTAELLPPKNTVVSSGTRDRERGAFFHFQQTTQNELAKRHYIALLVEKDGPFGVEPFVVEYQAVGEAGEKTEGAMLLLVTSPDTDGGVNREDAERLAALYGKLDRLLRRIDVLLEQADQVRNHLSYPCLGYGTKRANILGAVAELQNELEQLRLEMLTLEPSVPGARWVVQHNRHQQSRRRYENLARQADGLRNAPGFPYVGLGSAHGRATEEMRHAKDRLDQDEKALAELSRNHD